MGQSKGSGIGLLILGSAVLMAGFIVYFVPLSLQDSTPDLVPMGPEHESKVVEGNSPGIRKLQFNRSLPEEAQDSRYELRAGARVNLSVVEGNPAFVRVVGNASLQGVRASLLAFELSDVKNGSAGERNGTTPVFEVTCPCSPGEVYFQFDVFTGLNTTGSYRYDLQLSNASVELRPVDRDGDRILDRNQWVPGVPQYFLGFPLTVVGGVILVRTLMRTM